MDKRFNRSAMFYSIMFLAMLVFAVVAFFYGLSLGTRQTEEKYTLKNESQTEGSQHIYQQQELVSFYLTVYSPYREYQLEWSEALSKISNGQISNVSSLYKELEGQASKKATEAASFSLQNAGQLGKAQQNYIRSLNYFEKASAALQKKSSTITHEEIVTFLNSNEDYKTAVNQALTGQNLYFDTMYLWAKTIDPNILSEFSKNVNISLSSWSSYPLMIKNAIIASYLLEQNKYVDFLPQDLTTIIDLFISSGQAETMNINTIDAIISLLLNTGAVRSGDYNQSKSKLYGDEFLPQIPFFYSTVE